MTGPQTNRKSVIGFLGAIAAVVATWVVIEINVASDVSANAQRSINTETELHRHIDQEIDTHKEISTELKEIRRSLTDIAIQVGVKQGPK